MENLRKRTMVSAGGEIDYSKQYLTIVSLADSNTITWRCNTSSSSYLRYIYISTDEGATWTAKRSSSGGTTLATLQNGGRLLIKYYNSATYASNASYYNYFTSTQDFNVEGNIMSMTTSSNFDSATSVGTYAFSYLFYNCTKLKSAENLVLPATTLGQYCYYRMFMSCTGLTKAPKELPALTLANYCYYQMFYGCSALTDALEIKATTYAQYSCAYMFYNCTSLVTAPEIKATSLGSTYCCQSMFYGCSALVNPPSILPATTLTNYCYQQMFYGCSKLETAPELPALTLAIGCYYYMFCNCSKLNRITCLATSVSASNCKYYWVSGVASSGTFIKNKDITTSTWGRGVNGIPSGWIVENYKTDISSATVTVADQKYTGSALTPAVTVTLNGSTLASSNYTVAYSGNTEVGTATVTVTGTGDYYGQATGHFEIVMQQTGVVSFSIDHVDKEEGDSDFTYAATKNGDGALTYSSSDTDVVTVNSSTGLVSLVGYGTATITATMAETARYTGASDSYTVTVTPSFAVGETKSFSYTGTVQKVGLLPGTYQLQVWGAQGGSVNGNAGGKGGYSEGVLTVDEIKTLYAFVGGQGSTSGNGGWNGGGGGSGYSSYNSGNEYGYSYFGCGGGATDFALKTSDMSYSSYQTGRSSESLLSRIIVAGGGSGGAYGYQEITTYSTSISPDYYQYLFSSPEQQIFSHSNYAAYYYDIGNNYEGGLLECTLSQYATADIDGEKPSVSFLNLPNGLYDGAPATILGYATFTSEGQTKKFAIPSGANYVQFLAKYAGYGNNQYTDVKIYPSVSYSDASNWFRGYRDTSGSSNDYVSDAYYLDAGYEYRIGAEFSGSTNVWCTFYNSSGQSIGTSEAFRVSGNHLVVTAPSGVSYVSIVIALAKGQTDYSLYTTCELVSIGTSSVSDSDTQNGYVGGGTSGGGNYGGSQSGAGYNGGFGYGANQTVSNYRYAAGCGGSGWYGGGNAYSDSGLSTIEYSGGGSGWVNTSSSAGNRPSGYTGLQLDSGTTYDGTSSFPAPSGGNEVGHAGDGYAKITRTA